MSTAQQLADFAHAAGEMSAVNRNESAAFTEGNGYMTSGNWAADAEL